MVEHLPNMLEALFSVTNNKIKKQAWWHLDIFSVLYSGEQKQEELESEASLGSIVNSRVVWDSKGSKGRKERRKGVGRKRGKERGEILNYSQTIYHY